SIPHPPPTFTTGSAERSAPGGSSARANPHSAPRASLYRPYTSLTVRTSLASNSANISSTSALDPKIERKASAISAPEGTRWRFGRGPLRLWLLIVSSSECDLPQARHGLLTDGA